MKQSLLVSLVAHILVLIAIGIWPGTSMPRRAGTITIQQIKLVPPPERETISQPPPPQVEPVRQPPPPQVKPSEQRIARLLEDRLDRRRRTPRPTVTPVPSPVRRKTSPTPVGERPTLIATPTPDRNVEFVPLSEVEAPSKTPIAQVTGAIASEDQRVVFEEGFNYQNYTDRLMRRLQQNWDLPAWQPDRQEGIYTVVCFTIQRNGIVVNAYIEQPSGWPDLDDSALRAVRRASPVEPLPSGYGRPSVRAHVRFWPIPR